MSFNKLRFLQNLLALSTITLIIIVWTTVSFIAHQNSLLKKYSTIKQTIPSKEDVSISPTPFLICPPSGWIDCMPGPDKPVMYKGCSQDASDGAIEWYKSNCPDYQGIAY